MTETRTSLLDRVLKLAAGERRLALLVASVFLAIQLTQALSVRTADTLFFSRFGVENLPQMFILLGFVTGFVLVGYTGGLGRVRRSFFYPGLLGVGAVLMVVLRLLIAFGGSWVYPVIWVSSYALMFTTLTLMWNVAGDVVDIRSAKRLLPLFASAGILGGIIGNLAVGPLTRFLGSANVLLVVAVISVGAVVPTRLVASGISVKPRRTKLLGDVASSLRLGWSSPLLRLVAVGMVLGAILSSLVIFPFSVAVAEAFSTEAEIASYLGIFSAAASTATFLVSLFLVNRLFGRLGVVVSWLIVAVIYLGGFALWVVSLTLVTASLFRFFQWIGVHAVGGTARTALFNVVRSDRRGGVIAAYAAVPRQVGGILAGALLWVSLRAGTAVGIGLGLAIAAVFALLIWRMRSRYTTSLVSALRTAGVDAFAGPFTAAGGVPVSAEAIEVAQRGLAGDAPEVRRIAVAMLGRMNAFTEADAIDALGDDDLDVRLAALDALEQQALNDAGDTPMPDADLVLRALFPEMGFAGGIEGASLYATSRACEWLITAGELEAATEILTPMMESSDPRKRRAALEVVAHKEWAPHPALVGHALLEDESDSVRVAAGDATAAVLGTGDALAAALLDPVPRVRIAAATAWASHDGNAEYPLSLLRDRPPWAWEAAVVALSNHAAQVREEIYEWAEPRVQDLIDLASQHAALASLDPDDETMPATAYLMQLLGEILHASHRTAIRVLALLEDEETVQLIITGIRSHDTDARAQALEAAETVGGSLGRIAVPALEQTAPPTMSITEALRRTVGMDSKWARALAIKATAEIAAREWNQIVLPATEDPDPEVRRVATSVLARMEPDMTEPIGQMGTMERVLQLRRISLFADLVPDDLERLALLAEEVHFDDGEVMMREGEAGDRMFTILEGTVDVGLPGVAASHTIGAGEYVGILSAVTGGPRPASAYAVGDVSALSIASAALTNLILDRPEVARQMLVTVAQQLADVTAHIQAMSNDN